MGLDRTTLGRNLRPLERDGLVTIGIDPTDRRGRALHITPLGEAKRHEAMAYWSDAQARFCETYGAEQTSALHATMDAVTSLDLGVNT